jgi:hypothetical protein
LSGGEGRVEYRGYVIQGRVFHRIAVWQNVHLDETRIGQYREPSGLREIYGRAESQDL